MQSLSQLELIAEKQPNNIEVNQALADAYAREQRWEEASRTYRSLAALYPDTAALFINRIRLGAAALMVSSVLIFIAALIQPALSTRNLIAFATAISSPAYLAAQILFTIAFTLYSCSAISIYKLLSYTRDHRPAFWAMVLSVIGAGLFMPMLGIKSFVYPLVGIMFLEGESGAMAIYFSLNEYPLKIFIGIGGYLLIIGISIFCWVVWRNRGLSLPAILLFLAGWIGIVIAEIQLERIILVAFGALIALGGLGFSLSLWNQASTQFDPKTDRSLRS